MSRDNLTVIQIRERILQLRPNERLPAQTPKSELVARLCDIEEQDARKMRADAMEASFGSAKDSYDDRDPQLELLVSQGWHIANNMSALVRGCEDLATIKRCANRFLRIHEAYQNGQVLNSDLGAVSEEDVQRAFCELVATITHAQAVEPTSTDVQPVVRALESANYNVAIAFQGREPTTKGAIRRAEVAASGKVPYTLGDKVRFRRGE